MYFIETIAVGISLNCGLILIFVGAILRQMLLKEYDSFFILMPKQASCCFRDIPFFYIVLQKKLGLFGERILFLLFAVP
jgi:hypothetical protein